jgi:hypothetical protein
MIFVLPKRTKKERRNWVLSDEFTLYLSLCRIMKEVLPPALDSTSEPPPLFDGTTRLDSWLLQFLHLFNYNSDLLGLHLVPIYVFVSTPVLTFLFYFS